MHVLSPTLLELIKINTEPAGGPVDSWNFVDPSGTFQPPPVACFHVTVDGQPATVTGLGFKRRPLYAPLAVRDLRIDNRLYLSVQTPINPGQQVLVTATNLDGSANPSTLTFSAQANPLRYSTASQTAPQLTSESTQLYPFVRTGTVGVSGGHHDAGDYSKYTIDSAQFIHYERAGLRHDGSLSDHAFQRLGGRDHDQLELRGGVQPGQRNLPFRWGGQHAVPILRPLG